MMMRTPACVATMLLAAAAYSSAHAEDWKLDPAASRLEFAAVFEGAAAPGVFKDFDVRLGFDPAQPAGGHLDVSIRVSSASMSSADIDKAIAGSDCSPSSASAPAAPRAQPASR
jgi:polyisoprenoid-binding protein YceI